MRQRRFVILEHDWPELHWDFMLEDAGKLLTWRILSEPVLDAKLPVESSHDHRIAYLDYIGPVSRGRGTVSQWDRGSIKSLNLGDNSLGAVITSTRFGAEISVMIANKDLIFQKTKPSG